MDTITISDLEVYCRVGVTDEERSERQRLLITVAMTHDFTAASVGDTLAETIDYQAVSERLLGFGNDCQWQLIETLATDIVTMILDEFDAQTVSVEVKKFIIPQAQYVSVRLARVKK